MANQPEEADGMQPMSTSSQQASSGSDWSSKTKVSWLWAVLGAVPFGNLIAILYVLVSDCKNKLHSLLYLFGTIGPLIAFLLLRDSDSRLADLSLKLLIGNIVSVILVLALAVTLGALFSLGVVSSGTTLRNSCIAYSGYLCQNPVLHSGILSITFGQAFGTTVYNAQIACVASGVPASSQYSLINPTSLPNGQTVSVSVPCYTSGGSQVSGAAGTSYSGTIWLQYTAQSGAAGPSNPLNATPAATVVITSS